MESDGCVAVCFGVSSRDAVEGGCGSGAEVVAFGMLKVVVRDKRPRLLFKVAVASQLSSVLSDA